MRLLHRSWRHHGLGMLQSEITPTLRVHVWHPSLRASWYYDSQYRAVHDHRFDVSVVVLHGFVVNEMYDVWKVDDAREADTTVWTVVHAKEAERRRRDPSTLIHGCGLTEELYQARVAMTSTSAISAGESYQVSRGEFHRSVVSDLAVTLVHRSRFGEAPARVLGSRAEAGIVAFQTDGELIREVLLLAESATSSIDL